jgi:hypothetical protein
MPKKEFKKVSADNPALAFLGKSVQSVQDVQTVQRVQSTKAEGYCNINLRITREMKEYIDKASWEAHSDITKYLNKLIADDMEKNKKPEE